MLQAKNLGQKKSRLKVGLKKIGEKTFYSPVKFGVNTEQNFCNNISSVDINSVSSWDFLFLFRDFNF